MSARCNVSEDGHTICGKRACRYLSWGGLVAWFCEEHDAPNPDIWTRL